MNFKQVSICVKVSRMVGLALIPGLAYGLTPDSERTIFKLRNSKASEVRMYLLSVVLSNPLAVEKGRPNEGEVPAGHPDVEMSGPNTLTISDDPSRLTLAAEAIEALDASPLPQKDSARLLELGVRLSNFYHRRHLEGGTPSPHEPVPHLDKWSPVEQLLAQLDWVEAGEEPGGADARPEVATSNPFSAIQNPIDVESCLIKGVAWEKGVGGALVLTCSGEKLYLGPLHENVWSPWHGYLVSPRAGLLMFKPPRGKVISLDFAPH